MIGVMEIISLICGCHIRPLTIPSQIKKKRGHEYLNVKWHTLLTE